MANDVSYGLTTQEVNLRIQNGQVNKVKKNTSRSYKTIFFSNIFTFFNIVNTMLFFLVFLTGSYQNGLFVFVVLSNVVINLFQEIRAKRTLDKLALIKVSTAQVYRDNRLQTISINQLVIDDYLFLENGDQIPTDARIFEGTLEVNESLLTGEADSVYKEKNAELFSGSFVTSGSAVCQVIRVGEDNYIQKITKEAKTIKKKTYLIQGGLNKIIKWVSMLLIPLCSLLFLKQYFFSHATVDYAILHTVAAAVGMFPEGLFLLTSVTLTISAVYLARKKVLVQELNCIDALARVDVLCLDKTGTITEGKMTVEEMVSFESEEAVHEIMGNMMTYLPDKNPTAVALREFFSAKNTFESMAVTPFSSERKFSTVTFKEQGTYYLGAASFLFLHGHEELLSQERSYAEEGYRVIVLGHSSTAFENNQLPEDMTAVALFLLSDTIRENAKEILSYFDNQEVQCKIISGDDPVTVSQIAKRVDLPGADAYVDVSAISSKEELKTAVEKYQIFGRVSPQQKKEMIILLKELGHTVAMTGDGVNDVLALKEADCSIAMASGVDAARQTSNLVLLENQFEAMPAVMDEGRRVINNITRSGSLVLVQVLYSILITMGTLLIGSVYPFEPIQLTIINACFVGIPTFFLNLEADFNKVRVKFLEEIFTKAFPPACTIALGTLLIINIGHFLGSSGQALALMCMIFTAWNYRVVQKKIYPPVNNYRTAIFLCTQFVFFAALIAGKEIFNIGAATFINLVLLVALLNYTAFFQRIFEGLTSKIHKYLLLRGKDLQK
ncbi:HAD-IC family P-type ATPase [Enterococcus sp. LJL51]|uniref:HAD-IC family P-type ATPase n=1 Tax=Enterococcus sp. LJL51 TaxID=3416656 RepID=UPI003CEDDF75